MEHIEKQAGIQKLRPPTSPQPSFGITLRSTACKSRTVIQNSPTSSFTRCPYCGNIYCCWSFLTTCHCFFPHCLSIIATAILMTLNKVKSLTKDHSQEATWASVILRFPRPEPVWLPRIDGMNGQGKIRTGDASFSCYILQIAAKTDSLPGHSVDALRKVQERIDWNIRV